MFLTITGLTAEELTRLSVVHRKAVAVAPVSITTTDSNGDLFVTNDGASGNFTARTMRLSVNGATAIMEALR